jgi:hypothetical protein
MKAWWRCLTAVAAFLSAIAATPAYAAGGCQFSLGFGALQTQLPSVVGSCVEDQHFGTNGDALQRTSAGLMVWNKARNVAEFTDGVTTWVQGPNGLASRFNDEWFEWEAYPAETHGVPVVEPPPAPFSPTEVSIGSLVHVDQTLDNCGPAAIGEVLRYYGIVKSQQELQSILRPNNPYGMTTDGIPGYARSVGLRALVGTHGSPAVIKELVKAGLPVIVEQHLSDDDAQLHYRAIEGYDDALSQFVAADPYFGPRYALNYSDFEQLWRPASHTFVVLYPPSKQPALDDALSAAGWR